MNLDAIDMQDDNHAAGNSSERYVHKDVVEGLLFWISQGNFSALTIPAIDNMQAAINRAKAALK